MDKEGKMLGGFVEEKGWEIFNGRMRGDEEGRIYVCWENGR